MAAGSIALKHWQRIISRWPVDKLRPAEVSFQTVQGKRIAKYQNPQAAAESAKIKSNEANVQPVDLSWNEPQQMKQTNALYALLENRFGSESPLPERLRHPASQPDHYEMILQESERAPERGLLTRITERLKGMVRAS